MMRNSEKKLARLTRPRSRRQGAAAVPPSCLGGVPPGLDPGVAYGQGGGCWCAPWTRPMSRPRGAAAVPPSCQGGVRRCPGRPSACRCSRCCRGRSWSPASCPG